MTITVEVLLQPEIVTVPVEVVFGPPGLSAYQVAVANGFVGTEAEWLESLQGDGGSGGGSAAWGDITGTLSAQNDLQGALDGKASTSDSRLSDAREWTAETVSQAEAEAGTATTRRAWTAQRVFQAVAAWWAASAMKTKLDGIATGATANSSDTALLARANHTGTQATSTIDGLDTALSGKQATLVSGSNVKTINSTSLLGAGDISIPAYTHPSFTAISQTFSGAAVLASFVTNAEGHVTSLTTRSITASDVGADAAGTASGAIATHVAQSDPHTQYEFGLTAGTNVTIDRTDPAAPVISATGGGGGSPGGTTGQVQYNNAGAFAGASKASVSNNGNLLLSTSTTPAATAAGTLELFARSRAGKMLPAVMGPNGIDTALQPSLSRNAVAMWLPNTGTTASIAFGISWSNRSSGTGAALSHPAISSGSAITSMRRTTFSTGTTETGSSGTSPSADTNWRGNAAGLGGFEFSPRFAVETFAADIRVFVGMCAQANALTSEPSSLTRISGIGKDSTDTNWQIMHRDTTALATTKVDTGIPVTAGQILDLSVFCPPFVDWIAFSVSDAVTGSSLFTYTATTNLVANDFFVRPGIFIQSQTGTTAKQLSLAKAYAESDL